MDRDIELVGIVVDSFVANGEDGIAAKEVDRHALDSRDVDEGLTWLRIGQVAGWNDLRVEGSVLIQVVAEEPLAVELVDLVELEPGFGLEGGERADGLRRQRSAVHQEQDPTGETRL